MTYNEAGRERRTTSWCVVRMGRDNGQFRPVFSWRGSTRQYAVMMCIMGSNGCINLHSLCPAREYTETVQIMRFKHRFSAGGADVWRTKYAPRMKKGRAVVRRIGSAWSR